MTREISHAFRQIMTKFIVPGNRWNHCVAEVRRLFIAREIVPSEKQWQFFSLIDVGCIKARRTKKNDGVYKFIGNDSEEIVRRAIYKNAKACTLFIIKACDKAATCT